MRRLIRWAVLVATTVSFAALSFAAAGCGATPPPKELVDARANFEKAEKGLAKELAPADLDNAKQALLRAEASFEEEPEEQLTKDLAYIADRKAMLAEVNAAVERAARIKSGAEDSFKETTAEELAKARSELASGKQALKAEREARLAAEARLKAAIESLAKVATVKEESRGVVITLSGAVLFASGKSRLLPIARNSLDEVAKALLKEGDPKLIVEGHTDSTGSHRLNMNLSQKRADAVTAHLIRRGIKAQNIKAIGIGPDRPVANNSTPDGRANNRRVEIIVSK